MRKTRPGARGMNKVKSGCQTCKTRRKKCDEVRPSCSPCKSAGWTCDFDPSPSTTCKPQPRPIPHPSNSLTTLPSHMRKSAPLETRLYTYFHHICAKDFSLLFSDPQWEHLILRTAYHEPSVYHAGLAISAICLSHYGPSNLDFWPSLSVLSFSAEQVSPQTFALQQYNLAILCLNQRLELEGSRNGVWLAVFCSVVFMNVEFLLGRFAWLLKHLRGGIALVRCLKERGGTDVECLEDGLQQVQDQIIGFGFDGVDVGDRSVQSAKRYARL
ncbi:hypothetical protein CC80DRAFT_489289 [Byssothecium circinans]|uniref:Zn(2)-C6 fungal-type domain-containing protein n=1 Tax=Byssothecium circinans TaxID=147558 RepID=A0A6A5UG42_9PLEO|nr:hypothetical protein CC80DRAFT_489289 [Byssothecium circinans]